MGRIGVDVSLLMNEPKFLALSKAYTLNAEWGLKLSKIKVNMVERIVDIFILAVLTRLVKQG